ncbi:hypothetical protein ACFVFS_19455, partial [Kitasatospora sp. NPDC057692]|uniref:hypothetical protein n=1 Tax=Kitasatospora sp. NPDC057692 TaxID=3346215 RepID=UPI00368F732F
MTNTVASGPPSDAGTAAGTGAAVGFRPSVGAVGRPVAVDPGWSAGAVVERLAGECATGVLRGPVGA